MRRVVLHLLVVLLVASLSPVGLLAQSSVDDDFGDGILDPLLWNENAGPVSEHDGMLFIGLSPEQTGAGVASTWWLTGAFDVQVDYSLVAWPADNGTRISLSVTDGADNSMDPSSHVERLSRQWPYDNAYVSHYISHPVAGLTPTSDMQGTLRLVRRLDGSVWMLDSYYWDALGGTWVLLYSGAVSGSDGHIRLHAWGHDATEPVVFAFDSFRLNSGEVTMPPGLTIERVDLAICRDVGTDGTVTYPPRIWVTARDVDGASDIESVTIADPEGGVHVVTPSNAWYWAEIGPMTVEVHWGEGDRAVPMTPGPWEIEVRDHAGSTDWLVTADAPAASELSPQLLTPPPDSSVVYETAPVFSWTLGPPGAFHNLHIWDEGSWQEVWYYGAGSETSVAYNATGTASQAELTPGSTYGWQIDAWECHDCGVTDPRVNLSIAQHSFGRFTVYDPPSIEHVWVDRGPGENPGRPWGYRVRVGVEATGDVVSLTVVDPDVGTRVVTPETAWWWWREGNVLNVGWEYHELRAAPTPAPFVITVTDSLGAEDSLTTPPAPPVIDLEATPLSPAADGVINETVPVFEWSPALPGATTWIGLREEGSDEWTIWSQDVTGLSAVIYNDDGTAAYPGLLENHSYAWYLECLRVEDDGATDPRVTFSNWHQIESRFAVYGEWPETPPDLPGKLAYEGGFGVMLYGTDPSVRQWVGGDWSWWSDWSPDGTELLLGVGASILELNSFDGSGPRAISDTLGMFPTWAPDGERIAYVKGHPWDLWFDPYPPLEDICVANKDGSEPEVVLHVPGGSIEHLDWSPDGLWISHNRCCDASGHNVWLTRYDGTESRPVIPTGLTGYPGFDVAWMAGSPFWSPDGMRLGVEFWATASGGSEQVTGIGTISRDGGMIAPVFIDPPGMVCCASSVFAGWSPDGESVLFFSCHHLPPDPEWANGKFEHGAELFVTAADGTGEPVRLTYDYSHGWQADWWAPDTEPGADVSVSKGDTTVTFETVAATGSTTVCVTDEPPGETPGGFQFLGDYYDVSTTAALAPGSTITIQIHYDDADVPGGQEEWLSLMHWEGGRWVDITVRPIDTANNIITGECTSLSEFGIAFGPQFVGLLPPVNNDGSSIFKLNRTVPVKFQLKNADGSFMTDALAKLYVAKVSNDVVGTYEEPESTSAADAGNIFRYDADADQYIFNLGTKGLSTGTWALQVVVNDLVAKEVWVSLK